MYRMSIINSEKYTGILLYFYTRGRTLEFASFRLFSMAIVDLNLC